MKIDQPLRNNHKQLISNDIYIDNILMYQKLA